jgi:hypothetical protein
MRAESAISASLIKREASHGAPRSLAAQKRLARDDSKKRKKAQPKPRLFPLYFQNSNFDRGIMTRFGELFLASNEQVRRNPAVLGA